jgi:hypothetical protein
MNALYVLMEVCGFAIGWVLGKHVYSPWREERRWRRLNIAANARFARQVELSRQNRAAARNGRSVRTVG